MQFKGDNGNWEPGQHYDVYVVFSDSGKVICSRKIPKNDPEALEMIKANMWMIKDAHNVRKQINCSLTELLEQRNELLKLLKKSTSEILKAKQHHKNPDLKSVVDRNEELINKIENDQG